MKKEEGNVLSGFLHKVLYVLHILVSDIIYLEVSFVLVVIEPGSCMVDIF